VSESSHAPGNRLGAPVSRFWRAGPKDSVIDRRVLALCVLAVLIGIATGVIAKILVSLIGYITSLSFYGRLSLDYASPTSNHLGWWVVLVPAGGGLIVGLMAKIWNRGDPRRRHTEVIEKVLVEESRIPPLVTVLKPLSAAIAMGTGCPFGAEGPIIATGGALGSLIGQISGDDAKRKENSPCRRSRGWNCRDFRLSGGGSSFCRRASSV